jgi:leucyl/phenylalanyl-tRNA--protein transferase
MPNHEWPEPRPGDEMGLVALDWELSAERVISAYRSGVFPWPGGEGEPIPWVSPPRRAVLDFAELKVSRTLKQAQRKLGSLRFTIDAAFDRVIQACARAPRPEQGGTWITSRMEACYQEVHRRGAAHSVEAWQGTELVAGLYGVTAAGIFSGESMFHRIPDASKLCVLHLVQHLSARGATWLDIQQLTPHFARLGAREISRGQFLQRLALASDARISLFP